MILNNNNINWDHYLTCRLPPQVKRVFFYVFSLFVYLNRNVYFANNIVCQREEIKPEKNLQKLMYVRSHVDFIVEL